MTFAPSLFLPISQLLLVQLVLAGSLAANEWTIIDRVDTVRVEPRGQGQLALQAKGEAAVCQSAAEGLRQLRIHRPQRDEHRFALLTEDGAQALTLSADGSSVAWGAWKEDSTQFWGERWASEGAFAYESTAQAGVFLSYEGKGRVAVRKDIAIDRLTPELAWRVIVTQSLDGPSITQGQDGSLFAYARWLEADPGKKKRGQNSLVVRSNRGRIYRSTDTGASWSKISEMEGFYAPTLFSHAGRIWMIFCQGKNLRLLSSKDGKSWAGGVIGKFAGTLESGGGAAVTLHQGRLYYPFMDYGGPGPWPAFFRLRVVHADATSDLAVASNWVVTEPIAFPASPAVQDTRNGWLEANLVSTASGLWLLARVDQTQRGDRAACLKMAADGKRLEFTNVFPAGPGETGFLHAPWAGSSKFHLLSDAGSQATWMLASPYPAALPAKLDKTNPYARNLLQLFSTQDLHTMRLAATVLHDKLHQNPDASRFSTGFQQPAFVISQGELQAICRTSYGSLGNYHDANMITFHRVRLQPKSP
jgi:hypothetical protein